MSDISIRIFSNQERIGFLEISKISKRVLPKTHDWMLKPVGVDLKEYNPGIICLRLREFEDNTATLVQLETIKATVGYLDKKIIVGEGNFIGLMQKAKELGYEVWGEMETKSTEYKLVLEGDELSIFEQTINPVGDFIKIETVTEKSLSKLLEIFRVAITEKIEKNAAVLLGEKMGLLG